MRYETFKFIMRHKRKFRYDSFAATGNDNSTDPGATDVDPNANVAPIIGGSKTVQIIVIIAVILLIAYLSKSLLYGNING